MQGEKSIRRSLARLALSALGIVLFHPFHAHSETATVSRTSDLKLEHYVDAASLGILNQGTEVYVLETYAGWIKVRTQSRIGWVKANTLSSVGAEKAQVAVLDGGRTASGNDRLVTSGIRSLESPTRHALIIGIGEYSEPTIVPLKGVKHDFDSATKMAAAMGVAKSNMRYLRDKDATAAQIEKEIEELSARTQVGDRVFVYFSGHGARWYDYAINKNDCVEALMATDGKPLTNQKMARLLKPISDKADKLIVFYDACHSGGIAGQPLATRSLPSNGKMVPKFSPFAAPQACYQPANIRTRSLSAEAEKAGALPENFVQISSSRPDELSFDDEVDGGLATRAWRDCMLGDARDLDKSGGLSVAEITACAQLKLNERFAKNPQYSASHLTIGGNKQFIPSLMASALPVRPAPINVGTAPAANPNILPAQSDQLAGLAIPTTSNVTNSVREDAPIQLTAPNAVPAPPLAEAVTSEMGKPLGPLATLNDVFAQRDPRRKINVQLDRSVLRIGKDTLNFSVKASEDGYLYIVLLGSDSKSFYMLFPNDLDQNNFIKANTLTPLPRKNWEMTAEGPAGINRLLFILSDTPRNSKALGNRKAGPFLTELADETGRLNLQWMMATPVHDMAIGCHAKARNKQGNLQKCSDRFGAALLEVTEE